MHVLLFIIDNSGEYSNCCINDIFEAFGLHKMILLKPSDCAQTIRRNKQFYISHPKSYSDFKTIQRESKKRKNISPTNASIWIC